ncbi:hypothetical protein D018_2327A, partial [Vibrio parahaemolyticus VP2007-007]
MNKQIAFESLAAHSPQLHQYGFRIPYLKCALRLGSYHHLRSL